MIVRELITTLGFKANQADINKIDSTTNKIKDQAQQAANSVKNIALAFASFASVGKLVQIADNMQSIRARIAQLPQTIGDAGDAFDVVAKRASAAGASIDAYSSLYSKVGNAAKDYITTQEDLLDVTDTISKALVVGGSTAQESAAVMTQFAQALASGVLQGDEFRSMAEAAPQYLQKLSEAMGIPRTELKAMASDGKLTAKAVIEATRTMSDYFADSFKKMPMTVGRAMQEVSNRFGAFIDKVNRRTQIIPRLAGLIITAFDKVEYAIKELSKAFGGMDNMIRLIGIAIGVALGAKAIAILSAFRIASLAAFAPFLLAAAKIALIALVLEDIYVWIQVGDSVMGRFVGKWVDMRAYVMGAWDMIKDMFSWVYRYAEGLMQVVRGIFTLDAALFEQGLNTVMSMFGNMLKTMRDAVYKAYFEPIVGAIKDAWAYIAGKAATFNASDSGLMAGVGPAKMTSQNLGMPGANMSNTTNVTVTVPEGTPKEQQRFIEQSAKKSFDIGGENWLSKNASIYAR